MSSDTVEVTIFGKKYPVVAGRDAEYIKKLAQLVDNKMKEIAEHAPDIPSSGIAVLACLNIADEYMTFRENAGAQFKNTDEAVTSLLRDIEMRIAGNNKAKLS